MTMNIFTIIGCAICYLFAKCLTDYTPTFDDACGIAATCTLIYAAVEWLRGGSGTEYPSIIVGVLIGYAILRLYERIRK